METQPRQAPKREGCKAFIMQKLEENGGRLPAKELEEAANEEGYSYITVQRCKTALKGEGVLRYSQRGSNGEKLWFIETAALNHPST